MDSENEKNNSVEPCMERNAAGKNWEKLKTTTLVLTSNNKKNRKKKKKNPVSLTTKSNITNTTNMVDSNKHIEEEELKKPTKQLAIDCEMVGIRHDKVSMVARVSIVNKYGYCIYDKYVKPREPVFNYRTKVSGIRRQDLQNAEEFTVVQKEVAQLLKGRLLIGHALQHDLAALQLSHPWRLLRDTSTFKLFRQVTNGSTPGLKRLAQDLLGISIQEGEHSSVEDAAAAMELYLLYKNKWEAMFYSRK